MSEVTTATPLRTRIEGGGSPRLDHWGATSEFGVLRDVLVGDASAFRWLGEENAQYSALVRDTLRKGYVFDRDLALRQHGEFLDAYRDAGVAIHMLEARDELAYGVYARDSSFMTPFGAVICQMASPRRRGEYATTLRFYLENDIPIYDLVSAGNFEGGDFNMIEPDTALIGYTGGRGEEVAAKQVGGWMEREGFEVKYAPIDEFYVHIDLMVCMLAPKLAAVCLDTTDPEIVSWLRSKQHRDRAGQLHRHHGARLQCRRARQRPRALGGVVEGPQREAARARLHGVRPRHEPVPARRRRRPLHEPAAAPRPRVGSAPSDGPAGRLRRGEPPRSTRGATARRPGRAGAQDRAAGGRPARDLRARPVRRAVGRHGGRRPRSEDRAGRRAAGRADLLITSSRAASLARLGLDPAAIAAHPRLCHVAIVGYADADPTAGHDLNYQAAAGLVRAPQLPVSLSPTSPAASARRSRPSRCWPSATAPDAAARPRSRCRTPPWRWPHRCAPG